MRFSHNWKFGQVLSSILLVTMRTASRFLHLSLPQIISMLYLHSRLNPTTTLYGDYAPVASLMTDTTGCTVVVFAQRNRLHCLLSSYYQLLDQAGMVRNQFGTRFFPSWYQVLELIRIHVWKNRRTLFFVAENGEEGRYSCFVLSLWELLSILLPGT